MPILYMVRHGRPEAAFDAALDPGLDEAGHAQARAAADALAARGPLPIVTSPLARARETAEPLARRWRVDPVVESRVAELPSPGAEPAERARFVRSILQGRWDESPAEVKAWHAALLEYAREVDVDTAVFSHFIAINALVGAALGDERVMAFRPDHASVTALRVAPDGLTVETLGREAETGVR